MRVLEKAAGQGVGKGGMGLSLNLRDRASEEALKVEIDDSSFTVCVFLLCQFCTT